MAGDISIESIRDQNYSHFLKSSHLGGTIQKQDTTIGLITGEDQQLDPSSFLVSRKMRDSRSSSGEAKSGENRRISTDFEFLRRQIDNRKV